MSPDQIHRAPILAKRLMLLTFGWMLLLTGCERNPVSAVANETPAHHFGPVDVYHMGSITMGVGTSVNLNALLGVNDIEWGAGTDSDYVFILPTSTRDAVVMTCTAATQAWLFVHVTHHLIYTYDVFCIEYV